MYTKVKQAVNQAYETVKDNTGTFVVLLAASAALTVPEIASAASLLAPTALDGVATDATDTVKDVSSQMIPIVVSIMVAWSVVTFVKKGFGKAGIK